MIAEVSRTPRAAVYRVRRVEANAGHELIAKVAHIDRSILGVEETKRRYHGFRGAVDRQKRIAQANAKHWAPVHDIGSDADVVYFITDEYTSSVAKLIEYRDVLDAAGLFRIVSGIVCGLRELRSAAGGGETHGNLKPNNVLISDWHRLDRCRVVLTDPAPGEADAREVEDLKQLGRMIYALVTHEPWLDVPGLEPKFTDAWRALGRTGQQWHEMCVKLLGPDPGTLDEVEEHLNQLRPRRRKVTSRQLVATGTMLAITVCMALGALGVFQWVQSQGDRTTEEYAGQVAIMDTNWSWVLRDEEGREQLRVLLEEGAGQSVGDAIAAVDDDEVDARNAVERLRVIRSATSAWLDEFAKLGDRFAEQDWRSAAVEIGERVEDVRVVLASEELFEFEAGDDFRVRVQAASEAFRRAGGIAREWEAFTPTVESSGLARHVGLDVESLVSRELEEASLEELPEVLEEYRDVFHRVEERWGQVDASLEKIDQYAGQDPVLGDVRRFVHEQLQGVDSLDAVFRHLDEELHPRLEEMAGLASDRWAEDVDQPYFLANANLPEKIAGVETLREWIDQIGMETYTLLAEHEDPREQRFEAWQDEINELHAELEALSTDGVSEEIARRLSAYEEGKSDLQRIDWNGTRARRDEIEAQLGQLERSHFAPLLAQMDTERDNLLARCRERLAALDAPWPSGVSTALFEEIWDDRRDRLREGDETDCVGRLAELSRVQQTLRDLDERMANTSRLQIPPTSSRIDKRSIEEIISEKRMNLVEGVEEIDWSDQTQVRVFLDEQSARQKAHDAWVSRVSDFLNDASRFDLAVSEARGWEERFDGDETPASLYGRLQEQEDAEPLGMSGAFERLLHSGEAWETVSGMSDRAALLERVDDEGEALAVRMEAWRRLEEFVNREHENAIGDELAVRRALLDAIEELDELRAGELREELKVGLRERWLAYARAAETEAWLENAFANMDQAIGWDELAESDAPLAFDAVLFGLRRFVRADDNGEVREEVDRKIEKMRDLHHLLDGEHAERASVMLAELESALKGTADETADETVDVSEVGPARIGWEVEIEEDGEVLRFEPPAGWTRSHPLYFRRLSDMETTDGHAVYLCTTEVSVGLFIDAVTHAGEWAAVRELLGDTHEENGSDLRRGPRTWEWGADGEMKVSEQWLWFQDGEPADYYAADPGEPSVDHPMQYVSVSAAWYVAKQLGTRLPTASEWREAYEMVGGDIASELANLRDQTWAQQRRHREEKSEGAAGITGSSIFTRASERVQVFEHDRAGDEHGAHVPDHDDGALWFRTVHGNGHARTSRTYRDLVGNVAEFVWKERAVMELTESQIAPAQLASWLAEQEDEIGVIGGSALSHPAIQVNEMRLLTRGARFRRDPAAVLTFSDVGFRLALTTRPPARPLLARLGSVLENGSYLKLATPTGADLDL
ncbi:MAG: hypothetical protein EA377_08580 [Phycisphaerales bacterium]|nr:MAG: hypothetical protein EA377_08580 [Phycisphaerales bacterium]